MDRLIITKTTFYFREGGQYYFAIIEQNGSYRNAKLPIDIVKYMKNSSHIVCFEYSISKALTFSALP